MAKENASLKSTQREYSTLEYEKKRARIDKDNKENQNDSNNLECKQINKQNNKMKNREKKKKEKLKK